MKESATILVVDDKEANRHILRDQVLTLEYKPVLAENGRVAFEIMKTQVPDLILLDIMMPEMDGYQVLEKLRQDSVLSHIPVIVISAVEEVESITRCIKLGADDYLTKPFNPVLLKARINACLEKKRLYDSEESLRLQIESYNLQLERRVREQIQEISSAHMGTIFAMAKLAESRDPETGEHLERIREYCRILAQEMRKTKKYANIINDSFIENIYATSPLHDIGKIGIPDRVLLKTDKLTEEEWTIMKFHPILGAETLRAVEEHVSGNAFTRMGIDIALTHHEKWNGTGYPRGLKGKDIPLVGRIIALADAYDALSSSRCYRKEIFSHEETVSILEKDRSKHFDPDVIDVFLLNDVRKKFMSVLQNFQDAKNSVLV